MNFDRLQGYIDELRGDVYPQPPDSGHTSWALDALFTWRDSISQSRNVIDIGCGEAFLQPVFDGLGLEYAGICIGNDFLVSNENRRTVYSMDFHDIGFPDNSFDLVFSRHALEHSPMPILALMEWHRIARNKLMLILPNPEYWGWAGRNHYSVFSDEQIRYLLIVTGKH